MKPRALAGPALIVLAAVSAVIVRGDHVVRARLGEERREAESEREPTDAVRAEHERYLQRVSGRDSIPMDGLVRAKGQLDAMRARGADAGLWTWTWLGPGNIGGRIRSVLMHPTVAGRIWIGSASGGIWRTDNGGASWTPVDDFMANLSVPSLAMDPTNTNTMYAGTGEGLLAFYQSGQPGAGIFKSTDGGVTWSQLPSTNNGSFQFVSRLAHHPTVGNTLFACGSNQVFKSSNGGGSWTPVLSPSSFPVDVKVHRTLPSRILVGTQAANGVSGSVYYSSDGGAIWHEQTGVVNKLPDVTGRCEVVFGRGDTMYVSMDRNGGEVWRSVDAGAHWFQRNSGTNYLTAGGYANVIWVDPTNSNTVIVGGLDLWRSTNGGTTLTKISDYTDYHPSVSVTSAHADHHAIVADPGYGTMNFTVYFGNDGGIQKAANVLTVSENSGWTNLANNLGITQFYGGAAAADGSVIVGGTQDNQQLRLQVGGGTGSWDQWAVGDATYCAVAHDNPNVVYGTWASLYIVKSVNGGDDYFDATNGIGDLATAYFFAPYAMDPNVSTYLVAGGKRLWRTTNGCFSWYQMRTYLPDSSDCTALGIKPGNSNEIWAGYRDGTVSRSTNGGTSWVNLDANPPGLPNRFVTDIAVSPYFAGEVVVTFAGYQSDNVWMTFDGGATWSRRTGTAPDTLPALQVNTVTYHSSNPDWIYIGTDLGVMATETFGATWNTTPAYEGNDGPANVEVDDLFWQGDQLIAATHGRGMFRSRPLTTVYVDVANNSGNEDGTPAHPYNTVTEGINAAGNGTGISIRTGFYAEGALTFFKRGTVVATGGSVIIN